MKFPNLEQMNFKKTQIKFDQISFIMLVCARNDECFVEKTVFNHYFLKTWLNIEFF